MGPLALNDWASSIEAAFGPTEPESDCWAFSMGV